MGQWQVTNPPLPLDVMAAVVVTHQYNTDGYSPEYMHQIRVLLLSLCRSPHTEGQLRQSERRLFQAVDYKLWMPSPLSFVCQTMKKENLYDTQLDFFPSAQYLCQLAVLATTLMRKPPSWIAAGAIYLSKVVFGFDRWVSRFSLYSTRLCSNHNASLPGCRCLL